jgi:peptide/nickel transport system permease protein
MNKRRRNALLVVFLAALHLFVIFPGFFAPYDYSAQDRELPFAPPSHLHFVDVTASFHLRPFVYAWKEAPESNGAYEEDRTRMYKVRFFTTGSQYSVIAGWTSRLHLFGVEEPGRIFLFGTDDFGRDEFSRMLYGGRISLFAGLLGTTVALLAGAFAGVVSGYYGKWIDAAAMRLVELFLALPWLYLLLAVRAVLPLRIKTTDAFLLLVGVVGLVGWARPARLIRGIVLSAKERNFVLAARAMGASDLHILRKHVLPETYGTLLTMAALLVPQFILAEVTLSFLGLGVGEPMPSWGNLLAELQKYSVLSSYWWMYLPATALVALFLAYYWASVALQEKVAAISA